jgi:mRNA interferase MazF
LTSTISNSPTRLRSEFNGKMGEICFDQIRAVDKSRIIKILGTVSGEKTSKYFTQNNVW